MVTATDFKYKGWELYDAIDGLMAYDAGCTDSGIHDPKMKKAVQEFLMSLDEKDFRLIVSGFAAKFLSEEGLASGYGIEDVRTFSDWLSELARS